MQEFQIDEKKVNSLDNALRSTLKEYNITAVDAVKLYMSAYQFFSDAYDEMGGDKNVLEFIKKNSAGHPDMTLRMLTLCHKLATRTEEIYQKGEKNE